MEVQLFPTSWCFSPHTRRHFHQHQRVLLRTQPSAPCQQPSTVLPDASFAVINGTISRLFPLTHGEMSGHYAATSSSSQAMEIPSTLLCEVNFFLSSNSGCLQLWLYPMKCEAQSCITLQLTSSFPVHLLQPNVSGCLGAVREEFFHLSCTIHGEQSLRLTRQQLQDWGEQGEERASTAGSMAATLG